MTPSMTKSPLTRIAGFANVVVVLGARTVAVLSMIRPILIVVPFGP
jgi:hypothetical protein